MWTKGWCEVRSDFKFLDQRREYCVRVAKEGRIYRCAGVVQWV